MHLFVVVQPIGHFLNVRRHVFDVIHVATAALVTAALGDCAPTAVRDDFGETFRALRAHASFAPPETLFFAGVDFRNIRRAGAAIINAAHAVFVMHHACDVVGRGMEIGKFAATSGLGHGPFGGLVIVEPAGVIDQMAEHVRGPTGGSAVNSVDATERAAGDDFFNLFVMRAVAVLVADDRFCAGFVEQLLDLDAFGAGHRDRFFERNQFRAGFDADFNKVEAQMRQCAKAIKVGLDFIGKRGGIGADFRIADFRRGSFEARFVDVANTGDLETWIGVKSLGVMHSAFTHSDDDDFVGFHKIRAGILGHW